MPPAQCAEVKMVRQAAYWMKLKEVVSQFRSETYNGVDIYVKFWTTDNLEF